MDWHIQVESYLRTEERGWLMWDDHEFVFFGVDGEMTRINLWCNEITLEVFKWEFT